MSVQNRARFGAALAKGGPEADYVKKIVADRAEHPEAQALMTNLRRAKSQVGGARQVSRASVREVPAAQGGLI